MTSNAQAAGGAADRATTAERPRPAAGTTSATTQQPQRNPVSPQASRAALITGCSSGIGHAAALRLHAAGFEVYATARRPESLADLATAGIRTARLDVTDEASMTAMISRITAEHGTVDVLVNNAGFELAGPVEEIPPAEARRQFDTNFFGLARLTQLVIPGMRAHGGGTIINLSSVFGRLAVPGGAYYAASKHAVAALTDALRLELAAFGIRVVLIEPTATPTSLNANTAWTPDRITVALFPIHQGQARPGPGGGIDEPEAATIGDRLGAFEDGKKGSAAAVGRLRCLGVQVLHRNMANTLSARSAPAHGKWAAWETAAGLSPVRRSPGGAPRPRAAVS